MSKYILVLLVIAFITYLIELPIIIIDFYKFTSFKYLNAIVLMVNFFTNIILNGIIIPIQSYYISDIPNSFIIVILELFIIFVEYFLYKIAFKEFSKSINFKKKLLFKTIIANICSFTLGLLIINLYHNYIS